MARKIRADRAASETGKKAAHERAKAHFKDPSDDSIQVGVTGKVLPNMATPADMRRFMTLIKAEEADYDKAKADANALRKRAKQKLDKLYTDAADALSSRGMSERILKALYVLDKRDPDEVKVEQKASVWAMRALEMPVGSQLAFFDTAVDDPIDAYNKAMAQGRAAHRDNKSPSDNPHVGHQQLSQAWLEGYHEQQTETVHGMGQNGDAAAEEEVEQPQQGEAPDEEVEDTVRH